jgi:hypothetical protein
MTDPICTLAPATSTRRNGKIARLPKQTREMINRMLDDGLPYKVIIDELGEAGQGLNLQNLTNWKQGGYQDWLKNQELMDRTKAHTEHAIELFRETGGVVDTATIAEAGHMIGAAHVMDALMDRGALKGMLANDPENYIRILNLVCRLSNSSLRHQKNRQLTKRPDAPIEPNQV